MLVVRIDSGRTKPLVVRFRQQNHFGKILASIFFYINIVPQVKVVFYSYLTKTNNLLSHFIQMFWEPKQNHKNPFSSSHLHICLFKILHYIDNLLIYITCTFSLSVFTVATSKPACLEWAIYLVCVVEQQKWKAVFRAAVGKELLRSRSTEKSHDPLMFGDLLWM